MPKLYDYRTLYALPILVLLTRLLYVSSAPNYPIYSRPNYPYPPSNPSAPPSLTGLGDIDNANEEKCGERQLYDSDGKCVYASEVFQRFYLFQAPPLPPTPKIAKRPSPPPKLHYNVVFVRVPNAPNSVDPIVMPPAQQKTVVYVLNEAQDPEPPKKIEMTHVHQPPEVFYVNYDRGENPKLPLGIDLRTALHHVSSQEPKIVGGGSGIGTRIGNENDERVSKGTQSSSTDSSAPESSVPQIPITFYTDPNK